MKKIIIIVALLIVAGAVFYGGMKYGQSKNLAGSFSRQNFQDLSEGERQQLFQGNIGEGFQRGVNREAGSAFVSGEVIDKDDQSLTLKMPDGGSKIVFFSDSTAVSKMAEGSINDVEIGKQIMVSGEENSDGSYTAETIQLSFR